MKISGRFVDHTESPLDGPGNMAMDQALLESVSSTGIPLLRIYRWLEPTLTLGYFQPSQNCEQHLSGGLIPTVRRCTGGGAIVHDQELTYSLSLPAERNRRGASQPVYENAHRAISTALRDQGFMVTRHASACSMLGGDDRAFLCFERRTPEDLVLSGYKVVGSAQRRLGNALLQHGSILIQTSRCAPGIPGLQDLAGRVCDTATLVQRLTDLLGNCFSLDFKHDEASQEEKNHAKELKISRFSQDSWNFRR